MKRNSLARGAQLCLLSVAVTCTDELVPTAVDDRGPAVDGGAAGAVQFATSATDPSVIVWDTFSRTVAAGWGSADVGGAWYTQTSGSIFHVDGSRGVITVPDTRSYNVVGSGPVHGAPAMQGYGLHVGGLLAFQFDRMPDSLTSRHNVYVFARRNDRVVDGQNTYLFRVKPSRTGLELVIQKTVKNSTKDLTGTVTVKGTVDVSTRWWIRWEVLGVSPSTTARLRVWKEGTAEPTVWQRSVVVNEPALDQSGATGVRFAVASNQVTFPVSLFVDDLQYTLLPAPNQAPVAKPGGPYAGVPGAAVQFDGSASSDPENDVPLTYAWNFGDGSTGTGATPTHVYSAAGNYNVTLRVTDSNGLRSTSASTTATITATPNTAPVPNASGPYTGTVGSAVQFDGSTSSDPDGDLPLTYAWNFGDGSTGTDATPTHAYSAAGEYHATLRVTDSKGLSSTVDSTTVTIAPIPNTAPVATAGGPYSGTAGTAIQFDGSTSSDSDGNLPLTYAWHFGDGSTGTGGTPSHTYATAGTYDVTLTVTDALGLASLVASTTVTVALRPNQAPTANPGGPYSGTAGAAIAFDGSASSDPDGDLPLSYAWTFGDGGTATGATPSHTYASAGTYSVTLTVTDAKGESSAAASATVTVAAPPNQAPVANPGGPYSGTAGAALAFDGSAASDPDHDLPLTYAWTFGDGGTATGATPSHTYASGGTYTVTLTVTDAKGKPSAPVSTTASITSTMLHADSFSRFASDGWGNADVGGAWRVHPLRLSEKFSVDGSRAAIVIHDMEARKVVGSGLDTYGLNVQGLVSISVDRAPDASGEFHLIQVYARRNDRESFGNNHYRFRLRVFGSGKMDVRIEKQIDAAGTWLTDNRPTNLTFSPGAKYWIRWEATGTSPSTTVRVRVWQDGTTEPTTWHASTVHDEPLLDVSGTSGIRVDAPEAGQLNFPIRIFVDDFQYRRLN
jgi:PKD repeat protein